MSDAPGRPFQPYFDELVSYATTDEKKEEVLAAKADFRGLTGEVFEDDKQFEMRMASFLDYLVFDRPTLKGGRTPAREYYELAQSNAEPDRIAIFRSFVETTHGLFEVRKLGRSGVRLREVCRGTDYDVVEGASLAGVEKGDVLEARLVSFRGEVWFTGAFCFHPRAAAKPIQKEAKRRHKVDRSTGSQQLAWECARMSLKADRYRNIAVERIYDFVHPAP